MISKEQAALLKTILFQVANNKEQNELVLKNFQDAVDNIPDAAFIDEEKESKVSKYRVLFQVAKKYYGEYNQIPTRSVIHEMCESNSHLLTEEEKTCVKNAYSEAEGRPVEAKDYNYWRDKVLEGYNKQLRIDAITEYADLIKAGKPVEADKLMADMLEAVKPKAKHSRITFDTSSQLRTMDIPPIHYIVQDLIPEGLGLLVGASKSGKSAYGQQLGTCVALGKEFLGKEVKQGKVLWFCMEQYANVNKKRLAQQGLGYSDDFLMIKDKDKSDMFKLNDDGLKTLRSILVETKATLVIVDTFEYLAPEAIRGKNAYQQAVNDMKKIKAIANDLHVCILLVIHTDKKGLKEGDDTFKEIVGSVGFMSTADFVIKLSRNRMESEGVMQVTGRMDKEVKSCVKFDDNTLTWSYQKDYSDIHKGELSLRIKQVLRAEKKDLAVNDIWNILLSDYNQANTEKDHAKFKVALGRLVDDSKEVLRTGTKGHYRYSLNLVLEPSEIIEAVEEEKELTYGF